jgi:dihydrofolate reductase
VRPLIVSSNMTVDGFIAGPGNDLASLDFIVPDSEQENDLVKRFGSTADAIVLGRQTFLDMEAYWTKVDSPMADWLNATPKIALSTDPEFDVSSWNNSTLAAGDAVEQVRRIKDTDGRALVTFGGVKTIRTMVNAGLVDEYWLKISPVVTGRGSSMFAELTGKRPLTLRSAKSFPSGMIDAVYMTAGPTG